jgi:two-component system, OmpR family, sensor histidine kinase SenX3
MKLTSHSLTRVAFIVIIVFVLAQVIWWLIFQDRYIGQVTRSTLERWQQDAKLASAIYSSTPDDAALIAELESFYPQLRFDAAQGQFVIDEATRNQFEKEQRRYLRMFAFEGPFFVLVVLLGLLIIGMNLRSERELKRRQQNFLSAITHEFKTPMSTLRLLIETALIRNLAPEKQRDYLKRMEAELSRLERTSEQVLAAARLEQAREAPVLEPLELNSVMQGIIARARTGLEAHGAVLEIRYHPEALPVSLDPNAFSIVINNLLDNALKYSPDPVKPISIRLEKQGDLILTHIEDEGIGIAEKEKANIFERFYRVGSEMTRQSKGVGLGLHLVKSITEAMNGWVRVEAKEPKGSRFTIVLPRRVSVSAEQAPKQTAGNPL